ncbi:hypothetical protein BHM03_00031240 [Ensete ventricosum]|nr:hypothetical protein BHM03_00031240 [Ensete ventricosum]
MLRLIRERGREGGECKDKLQVPKAKGASGLMYIILEKHLTKELRCNLRMDGRRSIAKGANIIGGGAVGSSTSVNNTTTRKAMDSQSECHGTVKIRMEKMKEVKRPPL